MGNYDTIWGFLRISFNASFLASLHSKFHLADFLQIRLTFQYFLKNLYENQNLKTYENYQLPIKSLQTF